MKYLNNAFSINMVKAPCILKIEEATPSEISEDVLSVVGHESTARVFSQMLRRPVALNRVPISLSPGDVLYVGSLYSTNNQPYRPPEGKILSEEELDSIQIKFMKVQIL